MFERFVSFLLVVFVLGLIANAPGEVGAFIGALFSGLWEIATTVFNSVELS